MNTHPKTHNLNSNFTKEHLDKLFFKWSKIKISNTHHAKYTSKFW